MNWRNVLHPFLLAIYPILFLFAHNKQEVLPTVIAKPILISLAATIIIYALLRLVLKNSVKSALLVSLFLVFFFSYGHLKSSFPLDFNIDIGKFKIGSDKLLFGFWMFILTIGSYFIIRLKRNFGELTNILNIIALILVSTSILRIIPYELKTKRLWQEIKIKEDINSVSVKTKNLPDIYYLIFDRYAASRTLKQNLNFDNSQFTDYLQTKGFYLANKSYANYPKTFQSLASSLNMTHLTFLTEEVGEDSSDQTAASRMLKNHIVGDILKENGYTYYHLGPYWQPTRENEQADVNISWSYLDIDEFSEMLLQTTPIYPAIAKKKALDYGDENSFRVEQKLSIPFMINKLKQINKETSPKFIFAHFILPHGPYVFNAEGKPITEAEAVKIGEEKGYLQQLQFTNTVIKDLVETLLVNSQEPPIIVIQSDEGPCGIAKELSANDGWGNCGERSDWTKLSTNTLKIKMRILNAYYLPEVDMEKVLYQDVTPVNTFRIIFNEYFGANYKKLPDRSYIFADLKHPYKFIDVTDKVDYD